MSTPKIYRILPFNARGAPRLSYPTFLTRRSESGACFNVTNLANFLMNVLQFLRREAVLFMFHATSTADNYYMVNLNPQQARWWRTWQGRQWCPCQGHKPAHLLQWRRRRGRLGPCPGHPDREEEEVPVSDHL
ncbi:unnamed protein product [Arctogadus glacialis]